MSDDPYRAALAEASALGKAYDRAERARWDALAKMRASVDRWRAAGLTWRQIEETTRRYYTVLVPRRAGR